MSRTSLIALAMSRVLGTLLSARVRGSTRASITAGQHIPSLRSLSFETANGTLFLDLRLRTTHAIIARGAWEDEEQQVMKRLIRQGDVVFDIGAHLGMHTLLFSKLAGSGGTVHAFEPNALMLPNLRRTIQAHRNVHLHEIALGDRRGKLEFFVPLDESMAATVKWRAGKNLRFECVVERGDDLLMAGTVTPPQFIKIDVEGGEAAAFNGLADTIRRGAPVVMLEVCPRASGAHGRRAAAGLCFLRCCRPDYSFFAVTEGPRLRRIDPTFADKVSGHCNVVAVPDSRKREIADLVF